MKLNKLNIFFLGISTGVVLTILTYIAYSLFMDYAEGQIKLPYSKEKEKPGIPIIKDNQSDFLLVISLENIKKAASLKNFYKNDWSYAWVNTLEQEVGYYSVLTPSMLTTKKVLSRRAIIISKSAINSILPRIQKDIESFIKKGGVLILEMPGDTWHKITGFKLKNEYHKGNRITFISSDYLQEPYNQILKEMPVYTFCQELSEKSEDVQTLLEIDNSPAICLRQLGEGLAISLNFDYGLQLVSIQQGIPSSDYQVTLKNRNNIWPWVPQPDDLVGNDKLLNNYYPYADIFERFLMNIIKKYQPMPTWWYFPEKYDGAFIMTHDEDRFGDKSLYMTDYEKSIGATSTMFIEIETITKEALNKMISSGIDVQLHWDRMRELGREIGIWKFKPIKKPYGLGKQIKLLSSRIGNNYDIIANRNHFLTWRGDYTQTFRILHQHNIKIDSTYGGDAPFFGYLFGTGSFFYPIDTNGLIIPILEVPFLDMDGTHDIQIKDGKWKFIFEDQFMKRALADSKEKFHQTIVVLFHPHGVKNPRVEWFTGWMNIFEFARQNNHWITNFKKYYQFVENRAKSEIRSVLNANTLTAELNVLESNLTITIPKYYGKKQVKTVELDKKLVSYQEIRNQGTVHILVSIPKGKHFLEVNYL